MVLKDKKIMQIIKVMVGSIIVVIGPCVCASTMYIPIEIGCSRNYMTAQWITLEGQPGIHYTLTTRGLRDAERKEEGIIEVHDVNSLGRTYYGLHMFTEARCMPRDGGVNISLTGDSLTCDEGEGIKVKMFMPNSGNPDRYHYVGVLTITRNEKENLKFNMIFDNEKESLQTEIKLDIPDVEPKSKNYRLIGGFSNS